MTITLQSALRPLFFVSSFLCLSFFEYPLGQSRPYFSCLYVLSIWSSIVYYCYYPFYKAQLNLNGSVDIISLTLILITLSSILISFYRYKELKICLHELSIVDDTLEALGAPNEYQMLRNWIIRLIFVWITYFFIDFPMTCYVIFNVYKNSQLYSSHIIHYLLSYDYIKHASISSALICVTLIGYTSFRFHRVNDRLHVLYLDLFENDADNGCKRQNRSILVHQRITGTKDRKQYMWILT
ncbi:hypothetical protein ALC62_13671 [Cyphomyrmex costatus]|uniref:Gustatory receptor n=1 Tax=Cyphomyrmex costatus TaxID=456900 RepID=A0A151I9E5_9HYME|nr:hypothetical protein ALC62_13671 [Cyphomyrmex costatus]